LSVDNVEVLGLTITEALIVGINGAARVMLAFAGIRFREPTACTLYGYV
jgi:hypothetical protein